MRLFCRESVEFFFPELTELTQNIDRLIRVQPIQAESRYLVSDSSQLASRQIRLGRVVPDLTDFLNAGPHLFISFTPTKVNNHTHFLILYTHQIYHHTHRLSLISNTISTAVNWSPSYIPTKLVTLTIPRQNPHMGFFLSTSSVPLLFLWRNNSKIMEQSSDHARQKFFAALNDCAEASSFIDDIPMVVWVTPCIPYDFWWWNSPKGHKGSRKRSVLMLWPTQIPVFFQDHHFMCWA